MRERKLGRVGEGGAGGKVRITRPREEKIDATRVRPLGRSDDTVTFDGGLVVGYERGPTVPPPGEG